MLYIVFSLRLTLGYLTGYKKYVLNLKNNPLCCLKYSCQSVIHCKDLQMGTLKDYQMCILFSLFNKSKSDEKKLYFVTDGHQGRLNSKWHPIKTRST